MTKKKQPENHKPAAEASVEGLRAEVLEQPAAVPVIAGADAEGSLQVRLPKTLHRQLMERMKAENVDMSQLVTYLLMRGIADSGR